MKRIPRDPLRFDVFRVFAAYGQEEKFSLRNPEVAEGFVKRMRTSVEQSMKNDAFLYGFRTEAMFEALVANLGHFQILKQEDVGEVYLNEETMGVPDFRVVLTDGSQVLIEVKNFYEPNDPLKPFVLGEDYLQALIRYSKVMGCDLKLAVYWVNWKQWTLVPPSVFQKQEEIVALPFAEAFRFNQMSILGDMLIGTQFPLRLRMCTDKTKPRSIDPDGQVRFHVSNIELYCQDSLITDPLEQRIALYLMFNGKWREEDPGPEARIVENQLEYIEHRLFPEEDQGQGFEIIGSLSSMFSSFYAQATSDEEGLNRLQVDVTPGSLGQLIPGDYKGDALPLWRFILETDDS